MDQKLLRRHAGFLAFLVLSIVLLRMPLSRLAAFSLTHDYGFHILLIMPISVYLIYLERRKIFLETQNSVITGPAVLLVGGISWFIAHRYSALNPNYCSAEIAAIVVLWIAGFIVCYGVGAFQRARFPLFFLVLLIPIPTSVLDDVTFFLQSGSAAGAYWLFKSVNLPVHRDGFVIMLPTLSVEVAKQCSGIRSSLALLITTLLVGQAMLRSSWRKLILVLAIVPLVIVKNAVRIVTISLLTIYVNPAFLHGKLHTSGGVVFYALALLALVPIIIVLRRGDSNRSGVGRKSDRSSDGNFERGGVPSIHREWLAKP